MRQYCLISLEKTKRPIISCYDSHFILQTFPMKKVLFVCLGNICRSPMAEYLFRHIAAEQQLAVETDSAGTSGWHDGEPMHCGTADILDGLGISSQNFTSRRVHDQDWHNYDYLIVMDDQNLHDMEQRFERNPNKLFKITDLLKDPNINHIPDPWYTRNFTETRDLLLRCCQILVTQLKNLPENER